MGNSKNARWVMTELPITTKIEKEGKRLIPILPVPVVLQYVGVSEDGKYMIFKNLIEDDIGALYNQYQFIYYYKVNMNKLDILDVIFRNGIGRVTWIMAKEIALGGVEGYEQIDRNIKNKSIGDVFGIFLGDKSPDELCMEEGYGALDYDCTNYAALKQNSSYKMHFQDFADL